MSRIGRMPITVPSGVTVTVSGQDVAVKGPKGELSLIVAEPIAVAQDDGTLSVTRPNDERASKQLHGLTRSLINNMVVGVTDGYSKTLELVGTGYRVQAKGQGIELALGFSHPVEVKAPEGITFEVPSPNRIAVRGTDKELVGQVAADIRKLRKPEPYKGKGVRYLGEYVARKAGKSGK